MTQLNLYTFQQGTKGEGVKDINTLLNMNFEIIRQVLSVQDELLTAIEAQLTDLQE